MGLIPICDDLLLPAGDGQVIFRSDRAGGIPDGLLAALRAWADPPAGVTVLVSTTDVTSVRLREQLRRNVGQGVDVLVKVFDPGPLTAVDDPGVLRQAMEYLGVAVSRPVRDADGVPERLAPPEVEAQRAGLAALRERPDGSPLERLSGWRAHASAASTGATLAAVPEVLFGSVISAPDSPVPVTPARVADLLGGTFQPIDPAGLAAHLTSGRASAALVQGWVPETGRQTATWLITGPDGTPVWVPEYDRGFVPFDVDGAVDAYTRAAERHATALLLDPAGRPYTPPTPEPAPPAPARLAVNTRAEGRAVLVGPWAGRSGRKGTLLDAAAAFDGPVILVDVRHSALRGRLTAELRGDLHETLRRYTDPPVVLATAANDELTAIVEQYGGTSVQPLTQSAGLDDELVWELRGGAATERYATPTSDMIHRALQVAAAPDTSTPAVVRDLLAVHTWAAAETHYRAHAERLRAPEHAAHLNRLLAASERRAASTPHPATVYPDRVLPAVEVLLRTAGRVTDGAGSVAEPQNVFVTEVTAPHTGPVTAEFLLGYLTNRPLTPALHGGAMPAGPYATGLLWLRELIQATVSPAAGLSVADTLAIMRGKGEFDGERAARGPRDPEILRAHATIAARAFDIVHASPDAPAADHDALLDALDCLTGEDRTAWAHIIWDVLTPAAPERKGRLDALLTKIATCH